MMIDIFYISQTAVSNVKPRGRGNNPTYFGFDPSMGTAADRVQLNLQSNFQITCQLIFLLLLIQVSCSRYQLFLSNQHHSSL